MNTINTINEAQTDYTVAVNEFADLTAAEFKATFNGLKPEDIMHASPVEEVLPTSPIDWQAKGAVTPVKNQGQCGSCWAFSTTGGVEGMNFIAKGSLVGLSEQQLVDCAGSQGNMGCNGGLMDYGFAYIQKNSGICTESSYPYTARDGSCKSSSCTASGSTVSAWTDVRSGSSSALGSQLESGPVSVAIEADQSAFQFYSSGILTGVCGTNLDHGVLLTGFGTDGPTGLQYWRVKNSWGSSWGEAGYIRMVAGKNECGITLAASQPRA